MRRLRDEQDGIAMIVAVILLFVILGIGTALMAAARGQERSSGNQVAAEGAYSLAEAALNAQIYSLSVSWPTSAANAASPFPSSCNAASNGASYCPSPGDLSSAYPSSSAACPTGTAGDAWNASAPSNAGWSTYVRDAGTSASTQSLFQSSAERTMPSYDASGNGYVWVRSVATVNCHTAVIVAKVSAQFVTLAFPSMVLNANGLEVSNSGNKAVINAQGTGAQPSQIAVRCNGLQPASSSPGASNCDSFAKSSEISPTVSLTSSSIPILSATQLAEVKALAQSNNTYWPSGSCPTSASQLAGVVYIEGPCNLSFTSNPTINTASSPGFLVLVNGTINFGGTVTYYGVIYCLNAQGLAGDVVTLGGTATVLGGIDVDGNGTANLGSSGNGITLNGTEYDGDVVYYPPAFSGLEGFAGATQTPNSFRVLPVTQ